MGIEYPIFVRDRDGQVTRFDSETDVMGQLEAIDVEEMEYESWDSAGQILEMKAYGVGVWDPGKFRIQGTGRHEDPTHVREVTGAAEPYRPPLERMQEAIRRFTRNQG